MQIDITESNSGEIMDIMKLYPNGQLETKSGRVLWKTNSTIPNTSLPLQRGGNPIQKENPMRKVNRGLEAMGNSVMGMMGARQ